jgi:hypothetical protein
VGTSGRKIPVDESQMRLRSPTFLSDDAQPWAGTESLYLWAEDLAESHVLEIQGRPVGDGFADLGGPNRCMALQLVGLGKSKMT